MRTVASAAVGVVGFLYRFVVGDDWTVAVVILLGLVATGILAANRISAWWLVPLLAIVMTGVSLRRAAQPKHSKAG
jgi:uncharacterized membrane protein YfcA